MKITLVEKIPDFFIVGAAKSGTTSLWYYLGQNPNIFMTKDFDYKELGFFSDNYGINSLYEYVSFFKEATDNQIIGEACHAYLSSPESATLIHQYNPNAKIIIILRNPIDRAYSLYNWMVAAGFEYASSFEKALELEKSRLIDLKFRGKPIFPIYFRNYAYYSSGLYYEQVNRYLQTFGRDKCYILLFENFKKNIRKNCQDILTFLEAPASFEFDSEPQNESLTIKYPFIQYHLRNNFHRLAKKIFLSQKRTDYLYNFIWNWNIIKKKPENINLETAKELQEKYKDDILKTGDLIQQDTTIWFKY
jgi:hypothetical protein